MEDQNQTTETGNSNQIVSYGNLTLPPVSPGAEVKELCDRVDAFFCSYPTQHKRVKPSDLVMSAFFAMRPECRSNKDWMGQAASSARDLLYPLFSERISSNNLMKLFKKYAVHSNNDIKNREFINTFVSLDKIYKQLSDLTHHGTDLKGFTQQQFIEFSDRDFDNLMSDFTTILGKAFDLQQTFIHTLVDVIVHKNVRSDNVFGDLKLLMAVNPDAKQYFYSQSDERWVTWLWEKGFLDILKEKSDDPSRYSYSTPELNYLEKVTPNSPKVVTDIILSIPISRETFNPEVIDRFTRICSILPAEQLKRLVEKIRDDRWIPLMSSFNQWGFEYEKMLKALSDAKDYDSVLIIAEAILTLRTKEEMKQDANRYLNENPFFFSELEYTNVFEYLIAVDDEHKEKALDMVLRAMSGAILTGESRDEKVFAVSETYHLYDVDFFTINLRHERSHRNYREDMRSLAATAKTLIVDLVGKKCGEIGFVRDVYTKYVAPLPDSNSLWRFRLFALSQCPQSFKEELKQVFWRIFETEYYHELISGTEYHETLKRGFSVLGDDKGEYVRRVFEYFSKKAEDEDRQKWLTRDGWQILSTVCEELTADEQQKCEEVFGRKCNPDYKREPVISTSAGAGMIVPKAPISPEEFGKLPIRDIVDKLQNEWKPENLREQNTSEDFFHPLNAEGMGTRINEDQINRLQDYLSNAPLFFDREKLDPHYTYAFFRGIQEIFRNKKSDPTTVNWDGLITLCLAIKQSGEQTPFDDVMRRDRDAFGWLASWTGVHSVMADVLLQLATEVDGKIVIPFVQKRNDLLAILGYLLSHPDPKPEDEKIQSAKIKMKSPGEDYEIGDPFTTAINSVRGRAFQAFVTFVYLDGKKFEKDAEIKIADDVKKLYAEVLGRENTQALMFMFGHYLPSFYYRHKQWIRDIIPHIFPEAPEKNDLYLAAWEGYISTSLYEEMFSDPAIRALYFRAIEVKPTDYTKRRYVKALDEGLGVHLALAFMYYDTFNFGDDLFNKFWESGNTERYGEFISFIGRSFISGDNKKSDELLSKNPASKRKLGEFWDWALEHCSDGEALKEFGFWMGAEKGIFEIVWQAEHVRKTLEKTHGLIEWDFGLMQSLPTFAESAPREALEILRWLLLEGGVRSSRMQRPFYSGDDSFKAFQTIYTSGDTELKEKVYKLIDDLIREGGSAFWRLKEVI